MCRAVRLKFELNCRYFTIVVFQLIITLCLLHYSKKNSVGKLIKLFRGKFDSGRIL